MPLLPPNFFGLLDSSNPKGTDSRTISDDEHRAIKQSCQNQAPNWTGTINATHDDVNLVAGLVAAGSKVLPGVANQTIAYRYQNTADTGWTVEEPDTNVRELVIGPAAGGETIGGSIDPTNLTQTATVTITSFSGTTSQDGNHPHGAGTLDADNTPATYQAISGAVPATTTGTHGHNISGETAEAGLHQHSVSGTTGAGTADISIAPRYARGILQKLS